MKMSVRDLRFVHRFVPAADASAPVLLLLHGTGGNEDDLVPVASLLWPGAAILSPRGQVLENGMPRFFRRIREGLFDEADLRRRTQDLADFVGDAAAAYHLSPERLIAVGYSNGANVAASVLLLRPEAFSRAILWHAQVPLEPEPLPDLQRHHVLITGGRSDPIVQPAATEQLQALLVRCAADVSVAWCDGGHALSQVDVDAARQWLRPPRGQDTR
jgi:predicted esterase